MPIDRGGLGSSNVNCIYISMIILELITAWKVSKYGVISGPYFPVFELNTGKYGPEITPYFDTFHAVNFSSRSWFRKDKLNINLYIPCKVIFVDLFLNLKNYFFLQEVIIFHFG